MRTSNHNIKILWDGNAALVVHKPAGIATQAANGIKSLETVLRTQLAERTDYLAFPHRLDRPVSGVILVATRKRAARLLSDQFASRKVIKTYLAWVTGKVESQHLGLWVDHLRKVTQRSHTEIVQPGSEGARVAETRASLRLYDYATNRSLLELSPLTGRMHQLRLQTAHRGFPIIGDWQYGGQKMVDESGNFAAEMGKTADHSQGDLPRSKSRSSDEPAQSGDSEAPAASEGPVSELETRGSDGKARPCDHILLQAQRIQFHDPTTGTLQTVTASDELPQSV
jgi:23S rRNA-/tRNA-specific pseudouridylate synthase